VQIIFRHTSFAKKTGGHVLTPDFGTMQNTVKMDSNEKVFYMIKFTLPSETTLMFRPSPFGIISRAKIILGLLYLDVLSAFGSITAPRRPRLK
jgi:hypothetical protein